MLARTLLAAALALLAAAAPAAAAVPLPLGPRGLDEHRVSRVVGPGVTYTRIERGVAPEDAAWVVDVAFVATRREARAAAARIRAAGAAPRTEVVAGSPLDDAPGRAGLLVRTGAFADEAEALAERDRLVAAGLTGLRVVHTSEDGRPTTGPWVVHVLAVDRSVLAAGRVDGVLATGLVPGREPLSLLAPRAGALAAINGGYFVVGEADGTPGDLAGTSVVDGELVSEAVDGRTALVLDRGGASIAALRDTLTATAADGATRAVDGVNREPGLVRGCGGTGDAPTDRPKHDATCTDEDELIVLRPVFGASAPEGEGAEVALDAAGRVVEVRARRGGAIPEGGSVLAGTGDAAAWLREHAPLGAVVELAAEIRAEGGPLTAGAAAADVRAEGGALGAVGAGAPATAPPLAVGSPALDVVNGGPCLLRSGRPDVRAVAEGFAWPEDPGFLYRFGLRRNPRTLAGVTGAGDLLLVAVDGRRPGTSVGATFAESARLLRALGARDGVNLDGGGSTTLTLGDDVVNLPSDPTGERPIADGVVIGP
jgi:hypothetical protein